MTVRPGLHMCECEELKKREKVCIHNFLHKIITHYENNKKTQEGREV